MPPMWTDADERALSKFEPSSTQQSLRPPAQEHATELAHRRALAALAAAHHQLAAEQRHLTAEPPGTWTRRPSYTHPLNVASEFHHPTSGPAALGGRRRGGCGHGTAPHPLPPPPARAVVPSSRPSAARVIAQFEDGDEAPYYVPSPRAQRRPAPHLPRRLNVQRSGNEFAVTRTDVQAVGTGKAEGGRAAKEEGDYVLVDAVAKGEAEASDDEWLLV